SMPFACSGGVLQLCGLMCAQECASIGAMEQAIDENTPRPLTLARHLFWQGYRVTDIAEYLEIPAQTIYTWRRRHGWEKARPVDRVEGALEARLVQLIVKERKTAGDFKEIDLLGRQMDRIARVRSFEKTGNNADLNPKLKNRGYASGRVRREKKWRQNDLSAAQVEAVAQAFHAQLFGYQREWYAAGQRHRIRNLLKSRQIGATWYFAREAIVDALETGKNKIFLSASQAQANIFRTYIVQLVQQAADVELKGSPIHLTNGAVLHFLGTNSKTAQGYHGDVYLDEYFWVQGFQEFRRVVSGMAMHKKWRQTYISTPSSIGHAAYPVWTAKLSNRGRPRAEQIALEVSQVALSGGRACEDGQWGQIVTVHDALAKGCNLFDLEQLRNEYSAEEFANLLECEFVDDTLSAFPLLTMQSCMVDSWDAWDDVRPFAPRPVGDAPVWLGYDPGSESLQGDGAGLVVVLPSATPGGTHRALERHKLRGQDYEAQAAFIRECCSRFHVEHIGIDVTGMGEG